MTNVAMLLRLHPDLEGRRSSASSSWEAMYTCRAMRRPRRSSTSGSIPEAAQAVLRSRIPEKVMFPLDICNRAVLTKARFDEIIAAKTPVTERYKEDYGLRYPGFLKNPNATGFLWDELAAAWLLDTGFVTKSETAWLDIDTRFGKTYGATVPLERRLAPDATPVRVMLDLDYPRLWKLYKRLLTESLRATPS
jgi:inosine-uridine nucleoside N-ribohydrolase